MKEQLKLSLYNATYSDCALVGKLKLDLDDVIEETVKWIRGGEELHEIAGVDWTVYEVVWYS